MWGVQTVSDELGEALQQIARQVARKINDTPSTVKNVGEYCKQPACWNAVQPMEFKFRAVLPPEVRSVTRPSRIDAPKDPVDTEDLRDRRAAEDDSLKDDRILSIRQLFNGSGVRSRDDIITELSRLSGYSRTSARIREDMENTIRTAVRRGILVSNEDGLAIQAHTITEFDKEFLKDQFLASMRGGAGRSATTASECSQDGWVTVVPGHGSTGRPDLSSTDLSGKAGWKATALVFDA